MHDCMHVSECEWVNRSMQQISLKGQYDWKGAIENQAIYLICGDQITSATMLNM